MRTFWFNYLRRDVDGLLKPTRIRGSGGIEGGRGFNDMGAELLGHNEFIGRIAREHVTEASTRESKSAKVT